MHHFAVHFPDVIGDSPGASPVGRTIDVPGPATAAKRNTISGRTKVGESISLEISYLIRGYVRVFQQVDPPSRQRSLAINRVAAWHTWGDQLRSLFPAWRAASKDLPPPELTLLPGLKEYDYTYSVSLDAVIDSRLRQGLLAAARSLYHWPVPRRILLLTRMLNRHLDGPALEMLFAFLRSAIVKLSGDRLAALHTPLAMVGSRVRGFPLHADLYVPQIPVQYFRPSAKGLQRRLVAPTG